MTGPSAWYADQYKNNTEYIYDLSSEDVLELDAAVAVVIKSGKDIQVRQKPKQKLRSCHCLVMLLTSSWGAGHHKAGLRAAEAGT